MSTTLELVQQTLAEYERLAIGTGEWDGTDAPEFSVDGEAWSAAWLPTEEHPHPLLARAVAHRKGVDRPTVVVIRWDEAVPAIDEWRELWLRKPIALFGAFTIRAALRRAFRDVIGERREPDEVDPQSAPAVASAPPSASRDWLAELAQTATKEEVQLLHAEAKKGRAVTVPLERAIRLRMHELSEQSTAPGAAAMADPEPVAGDESASLHSIEQLKATLVSPRPIPRPPKVPLAETVRKAQPRRSRK